MIQSYFFFKIRIPASNIISIKDGYAPGIIGNPKSIDMAFKREDGRKGVRHILLHQFRIEDIKDFVDELLRRNTMIEVASQLMK
jgi:hypothetical protein